MSAVYFPMCTPKTKEQTFVVLVKMHPTICIGKEKSECGRSRFLPCFSSRKRPFLVLLFTHYKCHFCG